MSTKLDEQTLELPLLLPRGAQCAGCVDEVGRELLRLDGVDAVEADLPRGLLTVRHRPGAPTHPELVRVARHVGSQAHCAAHCPVEVHDHEPVSLNPPEEAKRREQRVLHVTGMDCADCAVKLGTAVGRESGVHDAFVNFGAATLRVDFDPASTSVDRITTAVRRAGYDTVERRAAVAPSAAPRRRSFWREDPRARLILVSGAFVVAGFIAEVAAPAASPWLFVAAMVSGGAFVARAAFFSLRARQVDMNVLMSLAAIGAAAIGQWSEAALVTFLFGLGTVLQAATLERTRRAITGLMELAPPEATLLVGDREQTVPAAELAAGDVIVVRPGERLPVDGVVAQRHRGRRRGRRHRRADAGHEGPGRRPLRRVDHRGRHADGPHDQRRGRQHDRQDRPPRRRGPGLARSRADARGSLRREVHAGRRRPGGGGRLHPAAAGRLLRHLVLPGPGAAHHLVSLRARDLDAREHPRGAGERDAARHPGEGGRLPRAGRRHACDGVRQDRDADGGSPHRERHRPAGRGFSGRAPAHRGRLRAPERASPREGDRGGRGSARARSRGRARRGGRRSV